MGKEETEARLNFLTKIIGLIMLMIGLFLEYGIMTTTMYPPLAGMFQMIAILLIVVGTVSLIVKIV
ncbi:MAG: hypothetical protein H5T50_02080 [Nitrososphaeria archaeon]|nr:hypothetical protein [Nitrososphaeria archaeon]